MSSAVTQLGQVHFLAQNLEADIIPERLKLGINRRVEQDRLVL